MNIREKIQYIFEMALKLTPDFIGYTGKIKYPCVFVYSSPHVNWVVVTVYDNGWDSEIYPDANFDIFINEDNSNKADECIVYLEALMKKEGLAW